MSQPSPTNWTDTEALETLFLSAGDGGTDAIQHLTASLAAATPADVGAWPEDVRHAWNTGAEIFLESVDRSHPRDVDVQLISALARTGFDTPLLRDVLCATLRGAFSAYLDPAGLLDAIEVRNPAVPMPEVASRWDVMAMLRPGVRCWHPAHGAGTIAEVDEFASELQIQFDRALKMPLRVALGSLVMVRADTVLDRLLRKEIQWQAVARRPDLVRELGLALVSVTPVEAAPLEKLLVPDCLSATAFAGLLGQLPIELAPAVEEETVAADPPAQTRRWDEARGLAELVDLLSKLTRIEPGPPANLAGLQEILRAGAPRTDQATPFCEAVAWLSFFRPKDDWLCELLRTVGPHAVAWQDIERFVSLTDRIAGRLTLPWLAATVDARGRDYLAEACLSLPLRLWGYVEKTLDSGPEGDGLLLAKVLASIRGGDVTADALLWLWKSGRPERTEIANSPLLFRTLAKPVRGSFIKASKETRKLMLEDAEFQRHILRNGDQNMISSLVRCARHLPLLDSGELQGLLVRIVRLYPDARPLVEERRKEPARKPIGKITSARSFELRRRELQEIVNVKIPANARAIGHARGYGDLSENAEYKAAKDEQAYLGARRNELEEALHDVRPTDFSDVVVRGQVVPGCTVSIKYADGRVQELHLLGLWDSEPERNIISFETPVGRLLMGTRVGTSVTMPTGETATVEKVETLPAELQHWVRTESLDEAAPAATPGTEAAGT